MKNIFGRRESKSGADIRLWRRTNSKSAKFNLSESGMIIGLGIDLVEISRVKAAWERFGMRFAGRILHPLEQEKMPQSPVNFLAARFAAKEAAVKALGTGFIAEIGFQDLYVSNIPGGQPEMNFLNGAEARLRELGAGHSLLSLTHGRDAAAAVVILTA